MAATTLTTANDLTLSQAIDQQIIEYARAQAVMAALVKRRSLVGLNTKVAQFAKWGSLSAAAVNEGTDLTSTALSTDGVTITASEVGVFLDVTDMLQAAGIADLNEYAMQAARALSDKIDDDLCALLAGFSTVAGSTGVELTLDTIMTAIYTLEAANAPRPYAAVLHPRQILDLRTLLVGASGSTATYLNKYAPDLSVKPGAFVANFMGVDFFADTNVDTANAAADYKGAMFSVGEALGMAELWPARTELERRAAGRATEIVTTSAYGVAELVDAYGVAILSKAAL